jgi:hypothetical protein
MLLSSPPSLTASSSQRRRPPRPPARRRHRTMEGGVGGRPRGGRGAQAASEAVTAALARAAASSGIGAATTYKHVQPADPEAGVQLGKAVELSYRLQVIGIESALVRLLSRLVTSAVMRPCSITSPIRVSTVASIPACHAGDPGSIPGPGDRRFFYPFALLLFTCAMMWPSFAERITERGKEGQETRRPSALSLEGAMMRRSCDVQVLLQQGPATDTLLSLLLL